MRLPKPKRAKNKQQRINANANKILISEYEKRDICHCEAGLPGCMINFALSFHHRYKRFYYHQCPEKLSDFNQSILLCAFCHQTLEQNPKLSKEVFARLRNSSFTGEIQ